MEHGLVQVRTGTFWNSHGLRWKVRVGELVGELGDVIQVESGAALVVIDVEGLFPTLWVMAHLTVTVEVQTGRLTYIELPLPRLVDDSNLVNGFLAIFSGT